MPTVFPILTSGFKRVHHEEGEDTIGVGGILLVPVTQPTQQGIFEEAVC